MKHEYIITFVFEMNRGWIRLIKKDKAELDRDATFAIEKLRGKGCTRIRLCEEKT